jgi:hypothetical protein
MLHGTALRHRVLQVLGSSGPVEYKAAQVEYLLDRGLGQEVNTYIPEQGCTLFQHCVKTLSDRELAIIEKLQPFADLSLRDSDGLSVFDRLVPVQWSKKGIFLGLLEALDDPVRTCIILQAAIRAGSLIEAALLERLRLEYSESQWKSTVLYGQL